MNIFHRRHFALFCTIFAAASICGCFLAYHGKINTVIAFGILTATLVLATLLLKRHKSVAFKSALCVFFALIALLSQIVRIDYPLQQIEKYLGKRADITAVVKSVNSSQNFLSLYSVEIETLDKTKINTSAILEFDYNAELEAGEIITGEFLINKIDAYSETPTYYKAKNITLYLHSPENLTVERANPELSLKFRKLNQTISRIITKQIDGEAGNLVSALMLGNKDLLDDSTLRDFRRAGLSHVLAISGMHLSVLIFFLDFILKKLKIRKIIRGGTVIFIALFYLALCGFPLSTVRAFLMAATVYLAFLLQDESDLLTTLLFSLFLILLISPNAVYDIGLWLSFLAVVGIFVAQYFIQGLSDFLYSKLNKAKSRDKYSLKKRKSFLSTRKIKFIIYILSSITITLFANIFICVPAWLYFDEISLISPVSNLLVSPIVAVVLYLSPIFLLTSFISPLHKLLGWVIESICNFLLQLISFITSFKHITISMNYKFVGPITVILAIFLTLCLVIKLKKKWIIVIPPIIAGIVFSCCVSFDTQYYKNITQIDYIGGDESEMLLLRDGSQYSIIDISTGGSLHSYNAYLLSLENCATELNSYVITHYHKYHENSVRKILKKAVINKLYLPYPQDIDEYYIMSALITVANNENVDVVIYDSLAKTPISTNLSILLSPRYYLKRSTHPTFYFTLEAYKQHYTYFSESIFEMQNIENELSDTVFNSRFILLGTHGPKTKTDIILPPILKNSSVIITNNEINQFFKPTNISEKTFYNVTYCRIIITKNR